MQLENGSRVIIVGGGPAGSFTALNLLKQAAIANLQLRVTILEPRDFSRPGLGSCNKCAGILSSQLLRNLKRIGLQIPPMVIQAEIDTYILHDGAAQLPIHVNDPERRVVSIYRGSGPRLGKPPYPISFDGWLLGLAAEHGAEIRKTRALSIQAGPLPSVTTPAGDLEAELLILASGINGHVKIDPRLGYAPPQTETMAQDEIYTPEEQYTKNIHIFFDHPRGLIFGALISKNRYVNISLLGHNLPQDAVTQFLSHHAIPNQAAQPSGLLCGCTPNVSVASAQGFFSDRFAAVGDAAVTRLYKDGIGSAFTTAEAAAICAVQRGVSQQDFAAAYLPTCQTIARDNQYGRQLFRLWDFARRMPGFRQAWMRAAVNENHLPFAQRLHTNVLWGMFSGDASYRAMFWQVLSLPSILSILRRLLPIA
jgi:flavin-dependent dehydrogenase